MSDIVAAGQLRAFVERIERIEADIKELNTDKSEVYKELRGMGFDVKAVRQCVSARKLDMSELQERNAIFDMYWEALTGASRVHVHEEYESQAKASEDNGATVRSIEGPADCMAGEASRRPGAWTPVATDDNGRDSVERHATISNPQAVPPPAVADKAETVSPYAVSATLPEEEIPTFLRKPATLRPLCLSPDNCAGYGSHTCHRCKAASEEAA